MWESESIERLGFVISQLLQHVSILSVFDRFIRQILLSDSLEPELTVFTAMLPHYKQ